MSILKICTFSDSKIFQHLSDFLCLTLSSENSHQLGLNQPKDMFDHSLEEQGDEDKT